MKHYKEVVIPAKKDKIVDYITCDLCKEKIKEPDSCAINSIKIEHEKGNEYPESYYSVTKYFDLCEDCFNDKLIKWFEIQGCTPHVEKTSY